MRRIIAVLIFISLLLGTSSLADGAYNLDNYSTSELEAIYSITSNKAFGCVKVPTGLYIVGKDLPSGVYTVLKNSDTPGNNQDDFCHVAIFNSIDDYKKDPNNIFDEGSYALTSCNTMWSGLSYKLIDGMVLVVYFGIAGVTKADDNLFSIFWDSGKNQDDKIASTTASDSFESVNAERMYAFLKESLSKGEVIIKPFDWPEITVDQFLISETYIAKNNLTKEKALYALQTELPNYSYDIYSLSPSGNSGLFRINGATISYYNGRYAPTYPADVHGDIINAENQHYYYGILDILHDNNVIYSHNGKYASVFCFDITTIRPSFRRNPEPSLIDLRTGEIITIDIFADVQEATDPGYITTGCFSLDDKYFYYNIFRIGKENRTNTLYRYCIETETSVECCSIPLMLLTANMYETDDNHLISAGLNNDQDAEWLDISQTDGIWTASTEPFSLKSNYWLVTDFLYSPKTGLGIMTGSKSSRGIWFMKFFNRISPESNEPSIGIVNGNNKFVLLTEEEYASQLKSSKGRFTDFGGIQIIRNLTLSPDGHFALLLIGNKQLELILIDLETKESCIVSGIEESIKDAPLGPSIEWNSDKLIIYTDQNAHKVYHFNF